MAPCLPLDAHLRSARGLELDDALLQRRRRWRDQFDECRPGCLSPVAGRFAKPFLQPHIIQPQRLRDGINSVLPGQFDRRLPQRLRQLRPPLLSAAELIQLALQLHDWLGNGWFGFAAHDQPHLSD